MREKVISFNVNGIRAATRKGMMEFVEETSPDVFCMQEIKARPQDLDEDLRDPGGFHSFWHPAEKKGYSGVATWSKREPDHVEYGCGIEKYDREGRVLRLDFKEYSVLNVYLPSGSSGDERQAFKEVFMDDFYDYVRDLRDQFPKLIICGDFNICHREIDIHNPVSNKNSSGFLPHEREWVTKFLDLGFTDSFRKFNPDPHHYTWWTYRAGAYQNNKGWRIDYHMTTRELDEHLVDHVIYRDNRQSDHAPIELTLQF